ncbi:erythromycin esterase family protein [Nonomuraea sp. NPDC050790]|uniref:erythromycin esterase family protein n=1 Tax=Nonomuraea sp. NPDC050790 TaxID=3364371 RepID=UPI00378E8E72
MKLTNWIGEHGTALGTLDLDAPLDDLEPLREVVGDARVVALGESTHHVREFYQVRHRMLRFLVERCGFEVYALEAPFTQGHALEAWVAGGPGTVEEAAKEGVALGLGECQEMYDVLTWMRIYREKAGITCVGVDLPGSCGSLLPALDHVAGYLRGACPEALPALETAAELAARFHDPVTLVAMSRYPSLEPAERDRLTGALSTLMAWMNRLAFVAAGREHETALWHLRGAWYLDQLHRATAEGFAAASTFRDVYLAESVLRLLDGGARVVLAAHNWHIQRAVTPEGLLPAGAHLAAALGDGYRAIGLTSSLGRTTAMGEPTPERPHGAWLDAPLPPPVAGSVESAFSTGPLWTLADLRAAAPHVEDADAYRHTRMADYFLDLPVFAAFDAFACVSRSTGTGYVTGSPPPSQPV